MRTGSGPRFKTLENLGAGPLPFPVGPLARIDKESHHGPAPRAISGQVTFQVPRRRASQGRREAPCFAEPCDGKPGGPHSSDYWMRATARMTRQFTLLRSATMSTSSSSRQFPRRWFGRRVVGRRSARRLSLEALEDRVVPTVSFGPVHAYGTGGPSPQSVVTGDFTRDGRLDLVTIDPSSQDLSFLPGNGDGTFQ